MKEVGQHCSLSCLGSRVSAISLECMSDPCLCFTSLYHCPILHCSLKPIQSILYLLLCQPRKIQTGSCSLSVFISFSRIKTAIVQNWPEPSLFSSVFLALFLCVKTGWFSQAHYSNHSLRSSLWLLLSSSL